MDELYDFCKRVNRVFPSSGNSLSIEEAQNIVRAINEFLYTNYDGIGKTFAIDGYYDYISDFHKYWEKHHREILDCKVIESNCEKVADALHGINTLTDGKAFLMVNEAYKNSKLKPEEICRIRLLTANQDFRNSLDFSELVKVYRRDPSIFDEKFIYEDPEDFLKNIKVLGLGQSDKRIKYARNFSSFIMDHARSPYELIKSYGNDLYKLRNDMINCEGAGYGDKKTDMVLRDMVISKIWGGVKGFDKINVASDRNTIKVALRTGIISTAIPLVSSFLDIFCSQYSYIDKMNAAAWRKVWEIWNDKYPQDNILSPCQIDFFVYNVVGKQFCKQNLFIFQGENCGHIFAWHSARNKTCQVCFHQNRKRNHAKVIKSMMSCEDERGIIAIQNTDFCKNLPKSKKLKACPFKNICKNKNLVPPKSISIFGATGWTSAYTRKGDGGGGLMA